MESAAPGTRTRSSSPTRAPAVCRSHWRLCLTSGRRTRPPTGCSGRPPHARCRRRRRSRPPDALHLKAHQSVRLTSKPEEQHEVRTVVVLAWGGGAAQGRTLVAVAVGPADGSRVLSEEAPGVGFPVWVPAVAVVPQASARVLHDVVGKLRPLQTGGARVRLGHGPVVVAQFCEAFRAGQRRFGTVRGRRRCFGMKADGSGSDGTIRTEKEQSEEQRCSDCAASPTPGLSVNKEL